jgi:uncharacterized protein YbbC (DUF1343 family)/CubicO group peptidase (beta-lactamase class C family)
MFRRFLSLLVFATVSALAEDLPGFHADKLAEMDAAIRLAIADGRIPGGVLWLERAGQAHHAAFGNRAVEPAVEANAEDTLYDAASLTKVIATTPSIMKLVEQGKIDLAAPVSKYLPEFTGGGKEAVTIRHLMTHTSGTKPGIANTGWTGYEAGIAKACANPLAAAPGTVLRYSDINFILLGEVVRRVSGRPLDEFAVAEIFAPLGMKDTMFHPPAALKPRIAPTTRETERGVVHDPTSRNLGGVAGHAGLFTTAADLARYARMLVGGGEVGGVRVLKAETVRLMTSVQTPPNLAERRGLGWDIDSGQSGPRGKWFPLGSFGHTGWTGGSLWADPFSKTFLIFLSNRNHPTEAGATLALRHALGTLAAEAVSDYNFVHVPGVLAPSTATYAPPPQAPLQRGAKVLTGIDVLERDHFAALRGLRVGLITNHTGIDRERRRTVDLLAKADGVKLTAIFSPEHGLAGKADGKVGDAVDEATKLPIFSLYGDSKRPTVEQLAEVDALVFDIQDVGCRFYTYMATMGECLTAAAEAKKKFFVLDRPNPIGGVVVEGPMRDGEAAFVAWHDLPVRHGMTAGELAKLFNEERKLGAELTVIPCEGWSREMLFDETGLPWVNPSPNMRSLPAATLYPGVGLLEFCAISVGRGTDRPFELLGAPYINDVQFTAALNALGLRGVSFVPTRFTPTASVFAGKECRGVQMLVLDRRNVNALDVGLEIARLLQRLYPEKWSGEKMATLLVNPETVKGVLEQRDLSAIRAGWVGAREAFVARRAKVLIYR